MKKELFCLLFFLAGLIFGPGCGSGNGSPEGSRSPGILEDKTASERIDEPEESDPTFSSKKSTPLGRPGALTVNITTAGSVLPPGTNRVFLTIDEVSVYKGNEGWMSLPLKDNPCRIELFRLPVGTEAALTGPAELPPGKYARIRIGIKEADIRILTSNHTISISNYSLKTERDIEFEAGNGNPVDLVAVLNLGKSIQPFGASYRLFPAFYAIDGRKAAAVHGSIHMDTFGLGGRSPYSGKVWAVVYRDKDRNRRASSGEEIARFAVRKGSAPSDFKIRWLHAKENYIVTVEAGGRVIYSEPVEARNLPEGSVWPLNQGKPI